MPKYNFQTLSAADFEDLSRDLLQEEFRIRLEAFTSGRDRGIDLRYARSRLYNLVVQCKHYERSGYVKLKSNILRDELSKLRALSPSRYILCTSVGLTPDNKQELAALLAPFCKSAEDVFGREDIENLLGRHPRIETNHHKLWLTSVRVLERVTHQSTLFQASMERSAIEKRLSLYVQTPAYEEARKILNKYSYCIISGIPGIGKTTLAEILLIAHLEAGFEIIVVRQNIREALALLSAGRKQVVYYDDFLGRSSFGEKFEKNEDQNLLRLLAEVSGDPLRRVILTTREYILRQAMQQYERLNREEIEIAKCIVDLQKYTRGNRARILYNHLYFSGLRPEMIRSLLEERLYRRIIDHPNYSPRIIEAMTNMAVCGGWGSQDYGREFLANLEYPARLWMHAFDHQLSPRARNLLIALAALPSPVSLEIVEECCGISSRELVADEYSMEFGRAVRELDGSFVRTFLVQGRHLIEFHNPSIQDFMLAWLAANASICQRLLSGARYFEQVDLLARLGVDGRLDGAALPVVTDSTTLELAARRLLRKQSAVLAKRVYADTYQTERIVEQSIAHRIARIHAWAKMRDSHLLYRLVDDLARESIGTDQLESERPSELSQLARVVCSLPEGARGQESNYPSVMADLLDKALHSFPDIDAWSEWGNFVNEHGDRLGPERVSYFRNRLWQFCLEEAERISGDASFEEDVDTYPLENLAEIWGINIEEIVKQLTALAEDLPSHDEPEDDDVRSGATDSGYLGDAAIDSMFDSLRHVDRD